MFFLSIIRLIFQNIKRTNADVYQHRKLRLKCCLTQDKTFVNFEKGTNMEVSISNINFAWGTIMDVRMFGVDFA